MSVPVAMTQSINSSQIQNYWNNGVVYPLTAFQQDEALSLIPRFMEIKERMSGWTASKQILKAHLVSSWVNEITRNSRILDAVECLLGPNILLWGATFFAKEPNLSLHVGWHQDLLYWGLQPPDGVLTVWLALSDALEDNGAMQVICGSHVDGFRHHSSSFDGNNMLMSDQNAELTKDDLKRRITVELLPGQFSIHHSMVLHGSGPNTSDRSRIGLSINYISTDAIQLKNQGQDAAMLVRGTDYYRHFEQEQAPSAEFAPEAISQYRKSITMPSGLATVDDMTDSIVKIDKIV